MHPGKGLKIAGVVAAVLAASLAGAGSASASTFCVPAFHSACPNSGGNIVEANLEDAMQTSGDDGAADKVIVAPGTVTNATSYDLLSGDNDALEIIGAGPADTVVTSTQSGNQFVFNLNGARDVTMRDLTIRVPASMMDNLGGAMQSEKDTFVNVDIESRNVRSDGIVSAIGGSTFTDGAIYGSMGGSIDTGFSGNGAATGVLEVRRTTIIDPSWGILSDDPEVTVFARRVLITNPLAYGVRITDGAFAVVENSIISGVTTGYPVIAESTDPGVVIVSLRHLTISGAPVDPNRGAITAKVQNAAGNGPINMVARDTIIAGFPNPLNCEAPSSGTIGDVSYSINYSYFTHSANVLGDCNLSNANTIDASDPQVGEPQFAGPNDFHLPANSPAIDTGDPQTASVTAEDYDGTFRPLDGNGNGAARRDMGAYEFQLAGPGNPNADDEPPAVADPIDPGGGGGGGGRVDGEPPQILKLRFKRGLSESDGGTIKLKLSEAAAVAVMFKSKGAGKTGKRETTLSYNALAGASKLKAADYRVKAFATDADGNRSKPAKARVSVGV